MKHHEYHSLTLTQGHSEMKIMHPPPPYQRCEGGATYCFWDGSRRRRRQRRRRRKTSCPLCNLNTLWNILMILGRNVEQDEITCRIQDSQLWLSYTWSLSPFVLFEKKIRVRSVTQIPFGIFRWYLAEM